VDGYDADESTGQIQALINEDLQRIMGYSRSHPDEYGGCWIISDDRTYGVSFTASLARHESTLSAAVNLPERLRVQRCHYSLAELKEVCARIRNEDWDRNDTVGKGRTAISGFGPSQQEGVVKVLVQIDRPDISERLAAKYGDQISVVEGDFVSYTFT
jgi:hypothetical protein